MVAKKSDKTLEIDLSLIDEPNGILRMDIDPEYIAELAQSIKEIGLLQSILLAIQGERYEIVAGHCRYLAHIKAGLPRIRATVRQMTRQEIVIARATENLDRRDLTPVEEASTYKDLIDNSGLTLEEVGKKMGKSPGLVKRRMDILRMCPQLQKALHAKRISIGVAEELWPISDLTQLDYYLSFAIDGGCTVAVARQWRKDWQDSVRRKSSDVAGGGDLLPPNAPRPNFIPCDVCVGPVELGKDVIMRVCPDCHQKIINAIKGVSQ